MRINADFSKKAVIRPGDIDWVPSPLAGVERMMLDRIGGEVARATSIVRYAAGSYFDPHVHGGGEEYLVLEGIFSDEHGDYPVGTYVRNPVGTRHKPFSKDGCTIFVKLHQFQPGDDDQKTIDTNAGTYNYYGGEGVSVMDLHDIPHETVKMIRWDAGSSYPEHMHEGGSENLVLSGTLSDEDGDYPAGTWIRHPHGSRHSPYSKDGALVWSKTGHLTEEALGKWAKAEL